LTSERERKEREEIEADRLNAEQGIELLKQMKTIKKETINKEILNCFCKILYYYPMCLQREFKLSVYISQLKEEIDRIIEKEGQKTSPTEPVNIELNKERFLILKIVSNICDVSPEERKISFKKNLNSVNFKLLPKIIGEHNLDIEIYYEKEMIKEISVPIKIQEKFIEIPVGKRTLNLTEKHVKYFSFFGTAISILSVIITLNGLIIVAIILLLYYVLNKRKPATKAQEINFNFS
jgi:hypothetical protein